MKKLTITELKKQLKAKTKEEIIAETVELYKKFTDVKEYFQLTMCSDGNKEVLEKYCKIIENEFYPQKGFGKARLSVAKKAVTDFKKISQSDSDLVHLMLTYVEYGASYVSDFGGINEAFCSNMEKMFESALILITKNNYEGTFSSRCEKIVRDVQYTGWGFYEVLCELFYTYIDLEEE